MLYLVLKRPELFDHEKQEFIKEKEQKVQLEHSLVSLSKWESKWCKPFLSSTKKTYEETIDYIRCMTITQNVDPDMYNYLSDDIIRQVNEYIDAPNTATTISDSQSKKSNSEQITSEIIYYWMFELKIPFECQKWHLNRLLTQIRVCDIKNRPDKKMDRKEIMRRNKSLNEQRRQQLQSKG